MRRQEVEQILADIQVGTRLRLTYKEDCTQDPFYLLGMVRAGIIQFENPMNEALIWAVHESGDWSRPDNRVIEVVTTEKFDLGWFVDRTHWPLESMEIIN